MLHLQKVLRHIRSGADFLACFLQQKRGIARTGEFMKQSRGKIISKFTPLQPLTTLLVWSPTVYQAEPGVVIFIFYDSRVAPPSGAFSFGGFFLRGLFPSEALSVGGSLGLDHRPAILGASPHFIALMGHSPDGASPRWGLAPMGPSHYFAAFTLANLQIPLLWMIEWKNRV